MLISALLAALCLTRLYSYLLFHTLVEMFTVAVAWSMFFLAWNARRFLDGHYLLLVGIASLFTGCIDVVHTIAYKGMGVFSGESAETATQLWIAGRYMQSVSLFIAPLFTRRKLNSGLTFAAYGLATVLALTLIFSGAFPSSYVEDVGMTPFKILSEYACAGILAASMFLLYRSRAQFDPAVFRQIAGAVILTIAAGLLFTLYVDVYGAANMGGHLLRFVAFCLMYRAIVVIGLVRPYALLFRNLARSEEELRNANTKLEATLADRERLIKELQRALAEVKTLSGLLPICANCKKVRDDKGYWTQVEAYLLQHTAVLFSHGICPDCLGRLYPDFESQSAGEL